MDNQHRKITGYRELSQTEVDLMNKIKALGPLIEEVLEEVSEHLKAQLNSFADRALNTDEDLAALEVEVKRVEDATPGRFLSMAKTDLQTGLMMATRAVAQPTFF